MDEDKGKEEGSVLGKRSAEPDEEPNSSKTSRAESVISNTSANVMYIMNNAKNTIAEKNVKNINWNLTPVSLFSMLNNTVLFMACGKEGEN